jgi:hypothetical protein
LATGAQVREIYGDLARKISDGVLKAPIDSFYPIEDIKAALTRAQQGRRYSKVLVLPQRAAALAIVG